MTIYKWKIDDKGTKFKQVLNGPSENINGTFVGIIGGYNIHHQLFLDVNIKDWLLCQDTELNHLSVHMERPVWMYSLLKIRKYSIDRTLHKNYKMSQVELIFNLPLPF